MPFQRDEITRIANAANTAQRQLDTPVFGTAVPSDVERRSSDVIDWDAVTADTTTAITQANEVTLRGVTMDPSLSTVIVHLRVNGQTVEVPVSRTMIEDATYVSPRRVEQWLDASQEQRAEQERIANPHHLMFQDDFRNNTINILSADGRRLLRTVPRQEWISYSQGQRDELIAPLVEAEVQRAMTNQVTAQPRRRSDGIDTPNIGARRERRGRAERWNGSNWDAVNPFEDRNVYTGWAARGERERPQFPSGVDEAHPVIAVVDAQGNQTRITLSPDGMEAEDL